VALADRDPRARPNGRPCSVGTLLGELSDDDRATLEDWLADTRYSESGIWAELKAEGHLIGRQSIGRHRREQCRCVAG
jgi:hypothetical protein